MVIEATRAGELLRRVTEDPTDWRCKMCAHRERCWRQNTSPSESVRASEPRPDLAIPTDLSIPDFMRRGAP
jgi:hypothetical protein